MGIAALEILYPIDFIQPDLSSPYSVQEELQLYHAALGVLFYAIKQPSPSAHRIVCALSGGVGFGKTTLAARLRDILSDLTGLGVSVIKSDGWLRSNKVLRDADLFDKKGSVESHDCTALKWFIDRVKSGKAASGPGYAHALSEPDPENPQVVPEHCGLVILEGVGCVAVQEVVDVRVRLEVPKEVAWQRYWSRLRQSIEKAPTGSYLSEKYRAMPSHAWEALAWETNEQVNIPLNRVQAEQTVDIRLCVGDCGKLKRVIYEFD